MPAYDYDCAACGRRFEVIHGVHAEGPTSCPLCGRGPIRKAITAAAVHYKGSGWAKKERRATASSGSKAQSDGDGSSDGGSSTDERLVDATRAASVRPTMARRPTTGSTSKRGSSTDKGRRPRRRQRAPAKTADAGASSTTD